jgi:hypothetical protein
VARIRTIKPEFFTSLTIADLPNLEARLTFVGLWTHVDDDGRCVDEPRLVRAAIWPLDDRLAADVDADLRALHEASLIRRYEVAGRRYLAVTNWKEHQRIDKPKPSKLPAPEEGTEWRYDAPATAPAPAAPPAPTRENVNFPEESETAPGPVQDESATAPGSIPVGKEQGKEQGRDQGRGGEGACAGEAEGQEPSGTPTAPEPPQEPIIDAEVVDEPDAPVVDEPFDMAPIDRDGFKLTEAAHRWAAKTVPGIDVHHATALFIAHFRAQGVNRPNWYGEWQKWMLRESQFASERAAKAAARPGSGTVLPFGSPRPTTTDQRMQTALEAGARVQALLEARAEEQQA